MNWFPRSISAAQWHNSCPGPSAPMAQLCRDDQSRRDQSQSPGIASFSPNTTLELGPGAKRSGNHGLRHISIWGRVMSVIVIMRLAHWQGQLTENNKISIKLSRIVNHCPGGIICMRIVVKRVSSSFTLNHHRPLWRHKWSLKQRTFSLLMGNYGGKGTYR